ncbi:MAG: VWA domain-containing protein [Candidatus Poribacteria bacterium]|nr:VWA domain-containing protein [Candidatus Poribacteria bacterium]
MKPKITKTIYYALVLSIGLHIALVSVLRVLHHRGPSSEKDITTLQISQIPSQRALRPLKRKQHVPPKFTPVKQQQIEKAVSLPVASLPATAPIVHQNPVTHVRGFSLPTSHTLGIDKSGINSTVPSANRDIGSLPGTSKFDSQNVLRGIKHPSFKAPIDDALPSVSTPSLPTAILTRIGQHIVANRTTDIVDIVFIVDASGSMKDNINAVRNHLNRMTNLFYTAKLDFTLGIVIFRENMFGWDFDIIPQTRSLSQIKRSLTKIKCRGGENAKDALIRAADEVVFRQNADVHFILITDEYVSGNYSAKDVLTKVSRAKIKVGVIGRDEPFQKFIARSTGGLWFPIASLGAY